MISFNPEKIIVVDIDSVKPNPWNPKKEHTPEYERIKQSLEVNGLIVPIVVREKDNYYEIIDGEQRYRGLLEKGHKTITVYNEGKLSDAEAMELTVWFQQQVPFNEPELAKFLKDLAVAYGDALTVPYTKVEVAEYVEFANFLADDSLKSNKEEDPNDTGFRVLNLSFNEEQLEIYRKAISKIRGQFEGDLSTERAIELICADFLGN